MRRIGFRIKFDGTLVIIPDYTSRLWNAYEEWITENCNGKVCSDNYGLDRHFVFENSEEAMAFKLTFG